MNGNDDGPFSLYGRDDFAQLFTLLMLASTQSQAKYRTQVAKEKVTDDVKETKREPILTSSK
jgi:hypothetical protein